MIKLSECGMYKLRKNNQWVWSRCEVSPSGQFVAGADYRGIVHIWDLRNGRKLNEFKHHTDSATHAKKVSQPPIIQSMSFIPCGTAIAMYQL